MPVRTRAQGLALVQRLTEKYGPQVANLFNVEYMAPDVRVAGAGELGGDYAQGGANGTVYSRKYLRNASVSDLRGVVAHETTHALGVGASGPTKHFEALADYATYRLAPKTTPGWQPRPEVMAIAEKRGYNPNFGTQGDTMAGPGSNRTGAGSNKNTVVNAYSKKPKPPTSPTAYGSQATPPPADPSTYGGYAAQVMGLQQRLAAAMALKKTTIGGAQAQYMLAKQQAAASQVSGVTSAESDALQRGILGSSADLGNRAGAVTDAAALRQAALADKNQAVAGAQVGAMGAVGEFYTGLGQAQFDVANAQANIAAQRYQNDAFDVLNQNYAKLQAQWQRFLQRRGRTRTGGYAPNPTNFPNGDPTQQPGPSQGYDLYHTPGLGYTPRTPQQI